MIRELDGFVQFIENECSVGRVPAPRRDEIIAAVDLVQNAMEEYQW